MREIATAKRPLILGIGGGGDVVGALAVAEHCRLYHGADPIVGGVSWERLPIDPVPGPRAEADIEGASPIAPGVIAATAETTVSDTDMRFDEAHLAQLLAVQTVLVYVTVRPQLLAAGLAFAA